MKKKFIGEIGEFSVLNELLKKDYEVYRANSRIQVKTTILQNKTTNNSFPIKGDCDFLIIVIIDESNKFNYYILTRDEAIEIKGNGIKLSISEKRGEKHRVKQGINQYIDKWDKIKELKNGKNN